MNTTNVIPTTSENETNKDFVFCYDIVNHWSLLYDPENTEDTEQDEILKNRKQLMKQIMSDNIDHMIDILTDFKEKIDTVYKTSTLNKFTSKQQIKLCFELKKSFLGQPSLVDEDNSLIFEELIYTILYNCLDITIDRYSDCLDEGENNPYLDSYLEYRDFILTFVDPTEVNKENITPDMVRELFHDCGDDFFFDQDWAILTPSGDVIKKLKKDLNLVRL
jgi:hypothetical protein